MFQLPLGLAAFALPHLWKRLLPASRARLGEAGKGVVAVLSIAGIWLAARGYGAWDGAPQVWVPALWLTGVNNLLVLAGFYLFVASGMGVWGARVTRHPQLVAVILWAVASILLINRGAPLWAPPPRQPLAKEVTAVVLAMVVYAGVGYLHGWIGPWPFGG